MRARPAPLGCTLLPAATATPREAPPHALRKPVTLKAAAIQFRSAFQAVDNRDRILACSSALRGRALLILSRAQAVRILERLAREGVAVAVFPECALTTYDRDALLAPDLDLVPSAEEALRSACRRLRIGPLFGSIYRVNGRTHNTVVINSRGELVERYAKLMLAGEKWATPGNHIALFELVGLPSTVIVCHDGRSPEFVRLPALAGARIVYYISQELSLREERKLAPYRAQRMSRAVENRDFVVAAKAPVNPDLTGSDGQSRIINGNGKVIREADFFDEEVLIEELTVRPRTFDRRLKGLMSWWWRQVLAWMLENRCCWPE